jgi:hypothetical protein
MKLNKFEKIETYIPERKLDLNKEDAIPILIRVGNGIVVLGGFIGFFTSSLMMSMRGILGMKEKIDNPSTFKVIKYKKWMHRIKQE